MAVGAWQETWIQVVTEYDNLRALYQDNSARRPALAPRRPNTTQALFQHLYHFADALHADLAVPMDVRDRAWALRDSKAVGPVKRCGDITNSDKHAGRDPGKTRAVLVLQHESLSILGPPSVRRTYQVVYTDDQGTETTEDALALAGAAYEVWHALLLANGLIQR